MTWLADGAATFCPGCDHGGGREAGPIVSGDGDVGDQGGASAGRAPVAAVIGPMTRRPGRRRHVAGCTGLVVVVAVTFGLAGCSLYTSFHRTEAALQDAGYSGVEIDVQSGTGIPPGGAVVVSYSSAPSGKDQEQVAAQVARIVWETFAYRFGEIVINQASGGCVVVVCHNESTQIGVATFAQLRADFGPRPRGFNVQAATSAFPWAWIVAAFAVALVGTAATVILVVRRQRRNPPLPGVPRPPGSPGSNQPWPPPPPAARNAPM